MTRRIFVIRDFEIRGIEISLEDLRREPPEGYDEVIIPGLPSGRTQGQIFDDAVRRELLRASHVLAFVDLPNANVGFELGYALGLGKAVALARVAAMLPAWLTEPPLAGYLAPAARSAEQFRQLVRSDHWIEPPAKPAAGSGVLFMCPESGEGASLHGSRRRRQPAWQVLPPAGWSLLDLSRKLDGIGKVVWCIVPYAKETDERDGRENAADAIVAGFASACGLELTVLRHVQARPVADLQQWEHRFSRLDEFERLLEPAPVQQPVVSNEAVTPPTAPSPPYRQHAPGGIPVTPSWPRRWASRRLAAGFAAAGLLVAVAWFGSGNAPMGGTVRQINGGQVVVDGPPRSGRIENDGDHHYFSVNVVAGQSYTITLTADAYGPPWLRRWLHIGGLVEPYLEVTGVEGGETIAFDTVRDGKPAILKYTPSATGTVRLIVGELMGHDIGKGTGSFTVSVSAIVVPPPGQIR